MIFKCKVSVTMSADNLIDLILKEHESCDYMHVLKLPGVESYLYGHDQLIHFEDIKHFIQTSRQATERSLILELREIKREDRKNSLFPPIIVEKNLAKTGLGRRLSKASNSTVGISGDEILNSVKHSYENTNIFHWYPPQTQSSQEESFESSIVY